MLSTNFTSPMSSISSEKDCFHELEYVYQDGEVLIPRLIPDRKINDWITNVAEMPRFEEIPYLRSTKRIGLQKTSSIPASGQYFVLDDLEVQNLDPSAVVVAANAHVVSPADTTKLKDKMGPSSPVVREFAGTVHAVSTDANCKLKAGDRVCGWSLDAVHYANYIWTTVDKVAPLPDSWSFSHGATLPVASMTAYYTLVELAGLSKGNTIIIHGAATNVGRAAITLSKSRGASVIATVSNVAQSDFLVNGLKLSPSCILFSDEQFTMKRRILAMTENTGADVILNANEEDTPPNLARCLAPFGVLIQIALPWNSSRYQRQLIPIDKTATLINFDFTSFAVHKPEKLASLVGKALSTLKESPYVANQRLKIMPMTKFAEALAHGYLGPFEPIVLEATEETKVPVLVTREKLNRFELDKEATYVIAGGLGDVGRKLCRLMASLNAKVIVVLSRRTFKHGDIKSFEEELRRISIGLSVLTIRCDISSRVAVDEALKALENLILPPVKGVIQSAAVLQVSLACFI